MALVECQCILVSNVGGVSVSTRVDPLRVMRPWPTARTAWAALIIAVITAAIYELNPDASWRVDLPAVAILFSVGGRIGLDLLPFVHRALHGALHRVAEAGRNDAEQSMRRIARMFPHRWTIIQRVITLNAVGYFFGLLGTLPIAFGGVAVWLGGLLLPLDTSLVQSVVLWALLPTSLAILWVVQSFLVATLLMRMVGRRMKALGQPAERCSVETQLDLKIDNDADGLVSDFADRWIRARSRTAPREAHPIDPVSV